MKIVIYLWVAATLLLFLSQIVITEGIGIGGLKKNHVSHKKLRAGPPEEPSKDPKVQKSEAEKNSVKEEGTDGKKQTDLPDMPVYNQAWIKYLHYTVKDKKKAKAFYKNIAFDTQSRKGLSPSELQATDKVYIINLRMASLTSQMNCISILFFTKTASTFSLRE